MIEQSTIDTIVAAEDPTSLFRALGFEIDPIEIDLADWRRCGFDPGVVEPGSLIHAGRSGHLELLSVDGKTDPRAVISRYRAFNKGIRPLVTSPGKDRVALWTWASGRARQLELVRGATTPDVLSRIASIVGRPDDASLELRIERAFGPEDLEQQFLQRFRNFWKLATAEISEQTRASSDVCRAQSLLILSRLLFLSYVQLKGWLDENPRYLFDRAQEHGTSGASIYDSFVAPLFFRCLNTRADRRRGRATRMGRLPYLNGGLFARSPLEQRHSNLTLSNELVLGAIEQCFERFAFTITEDDEATVAIDPEMLGRVFEALMDEDERGATGSFYTPRPIVDEIVSSSLASWLSAGDPGLERVIEENPSDLPEPVARSLRSRLRKIRVLDPACGSGAFLMSALKQIERLGALLGRKTGHRSFTRRSIVERSLHGVDLEPEAVMLCELRLWLAIVATDQTSSISSVRPLPQLDRNILQGNSLLSELDSFSIDPRSSAEWARQRATHGKLVRAYRSSTGSDRASRRRALRTSDRKLTELLLRNGIGRLEEKLERIRTHQKSIFEGERTCSSAEEETRSELNRWRRSLRRAEKNELDFFSWSLDFAHVDSKFDLIVGNPPWVRGARLDSDKRRLLAARYQTARGGGRGVRQFDLASVFVERSLQLLDEDGRLSMLLPSKLMSSDHAIPLRKLLSDQHSVRAIRDYSREPGIFDADTFPVAITVDSRHSPSRPVSVVRPGQSRFLIDLETGGEPWLLVRRDVRRVVDDLHQRLSPLERVLGRRPVMGLKTGSNRNFFVEVARFDGPWAELTTGVRVPLDRLARCARGRDLDRWSCTPSTWMIWPPRFTPDDRSWLADYLDERNIGDQALRFSYLVPAHLGTKVAWKDVSAGMKAALLPPKVTHSGNVFPLVPNQTLYLIDVDSSDEGYAIAGFLNSSIGNVLASLTADQAKDGHRRYFARTVASMPMFDPRSDDPAVRSVIRLSRSAEMREGNGSTAELDRAVAQCMGLSSRELGLIEAAKSELGL